MSRELVAALGTIGWWVAAMALVLGGCWAGDRLVARRRQSARLRIRVRHLDSPAARSARHERAVQGQDAGCKRLLSAIPAQRAGGER